MIEKNKLITDLYSPLAIDFNAVKLYYKNLGNSVSQMDVMEMMDLMGTMINESIESCPEDQDVQLMCLRGLLILISNETITEYSA